MMTYAQTKNFIQFILKNAPVSQATQVIVEQPVTLSVNGEEWVTWMCTPIDLEAMALGFLFNEGHIKSAAEVEILHICDAGDQVDIWLSHGVKKPRLWRRTSGCTGGYTAVDDQYPARPFKNKENLNGINLTPEKITRLVSALFENQEVYKQTGGVHTSALSDGNEVLIVAEDVGRHNTLDKLAGRCLLDHIIPSQIVVLTTGRISSEMLQKASRMGAQVIISRTAPTSLSIQLAQERDITLVGYARRDRFNVYTHPERISTHEAIIKVK
jgi:FdhD protein